ncbi:MAG: ATP-binding protein [Anaerolineae bacterium]|nr:ATP-binding protein [Anaerolineae bacterium]
MSSLMDRLMAKRHQRFVGRVAEQELFKAALEADQLPFFLLYVYGPGGFGKTTLLNEFYRLAREMNVRVLMLDARNFEPTQDAFLNALRLGMGLDLSQSPADVLGSVEERYVIIIDTFELLAPIEGWLRDVLLPRLSETVMTIAAGRLPLASTWRTDPGWQDLVRVISLRNLSHAESIDYLIRREIPTEQHDSIIDFTYGHPLALSLVADTYAQQADIPFKPDNVTDVIRILMERFVKGVPSPLHRTALEASALVRLMNEALLADMLEVDDAFDIFDWLRNLSFVEIGENGVFLHDLTRDVLVSDLHWRNPERYVRLHQRARNYYFNKLRPKQDAEQARLLYDLVYLHKDNPAIRPAFDWQQRGNLTITAMEPNDTSILLNLVRHYEGEESARIAAYWIEQQPASVRVLRNSEHQAVGFITVLALNRIEDTGIDPAVTKALQFLQGSTRLRSGETALYFRHWMGRDAYQTVSPEQTNCFIIAVQNYLTTPGLVYTFFPCAEPDFWFPVFAYANIPRVTELEFETDGKSYGVYAHDWRNEPPSSWLDLLASREVGDQGQAGSAPPRILEPTIVLTQEEFEDAVQEALKSMLRSDELGDNPLLRSRLVVQRTTSSATEAQLIQTLQNLLRDAAEMLKQHPRDGKFYQAIHYTYLHPAPTQEQAAEILDLPFSTFRRHLKNGVTRIAEILWQQEVGGVEYAVS